MFRFIVVAGGMFVTSQVFSGPTPVISIMATQGTAPFAVHVHCLNSSFTVGDRLSSLLEWDFGDPGTSYNKLNGFNAAHLYEQPGSYTLTLSITDQNGANAAVTRQITVLPNTRSTIYVSADGNDSNSGTTAGAPIRTLAKAQQLLGNNKSILLRRGDHFTVPNTYTVDHANVLIGAYGSGARPVITFTNGGQYVQAIDMGDHCNAVVVQNIVFETPASTPTASSPRGISPAGQNITVQNCHFRKVSDAFTAGNGPTGWLTLKCTAEVIAGYFIWEQGTDHTHLGDQVAGSINEHNIRIIANRVQVTDCDLTNSNKSTIWAMLASDCWFSKNVLHSGRILVGPNFASGSPSDRTRRVVAEANEIFDEGFVLYSGAEQIVLRNNVVHSNGKEAFSIWGYISSMNRTVDDVRIYNNTATNTNTSYGRFMKIGAGATHITAINNLYSAPYLNTGYGASNVSSDDPSLSTHTFRNNLWATPNNGSSVHFLSTGGKTVPQWAALSQCVAEKYRLFGTQDLNSGNVPQFNAFVGQKIVGMFTDVLGQYRPTGNVWSVGAVELNPTDPQPPPPPPPPPPPTGNIFYDMEQAAGWIVLDLPIADGKWERGIPAGDGLRGDPIADFDGSGQCWLTGNRPGNSDVDDGTTTLESPTINMTGGNASLSYARWFRNYNQTDGDRLTVQLSNNNGSTWVTVESVADSQGWTYHTLTVSDYLTPTSTMKIRFSTSDTPNNSVTEAAIDSVRICITDCNSPGGLPGDINGDGKVDISDLLELLSHWGACPAPCPSDLDGDGKVDGLDIALLMSYWQ